ncbi:class I SAM-dependent methyltransferase [Anaeromicropila herbilytica]|uniref:SAM-dependent methyltransferase n=1 Tax=Anaeromicropila herbilytica TaxID=2785025 RepID=A0A7R7EIL2_9FIRM|nr:rRNA adenine N-6-methyltransferase family protein [Anaeromicropila herbilytica]BCN29390.1 SAM-dependent methyltransferase [Anaeromicropila herbilytica]
MLNFLIQFLKSPRSIGAIAPSGKFLARKMMEPIRFDNAKGIVEFGPGTGSFTREIVRQKSRDSVLILIENNRFFCQQLKEKYKNCQGVYVIYGNAENVNEYLKKYGFDTADYIISGLPFTSLPVKVSENILTSTQKAIGKNGQFITFQYSLAKKKFFKCYFNITECLFELRNLPPAYVLVMKSSLDKEGI